MLMRRLAASTVTLTGLLALPVTAQKTILSRANFPRGGTCPLTWGTPWQDGAGPIHLGVTNTTGWDIKVKVHSSLRIGQKLVIDGDGANLRPSGSADLIIQHKPGGVVLGQDLSITIESCPVPK